VFCREKEPEKDAWKRAHEVPQVLRPAKGNLARDKVGNKTGRIFVDRQDLDQLPTRKRKELKALHKQQQQE
jgi:hypothetical protein